MSRPDLWGSDNPERVASEGEAPSDYRRHERDEDADYEAYRDSSIDDTFKSIFSEMDELAAKRAEPAPENLFAKAWRLNAMRDADAVLRDGLRSSYKLEAALKGLPIPSDAEVDAMIENDMNRGQEHAQE